MGRQVVTSKDLLVGNEVKALSRNNLSVDTYKDRLLKYIPAEVVAAYLLLNGISLEADIPEWMNWTIFAICLVLTYFYLNRIEKVDKKLQLIISVVAFVVWVFAIGGPFELTAWYRPIYGALLLPLYTIAIPIMEA